jgi:hypothetical protein
MPEIAPQIFQASCLDTVIQFVVDAVKSNMGPVRRTCGMISQKRLQCGWRKETNSGESKR